MSRKRLKFTDQEWSDLIQDCMRSSLKVKTWCDQHDMTVKALYYHMRRLRQIGYVFPQRSPLTLPVPQDPPEIVCLDIPGQTLANPTILPQLHTENAGTAAIRVHYNSILIDVSNHAAQDTIINTFRALQVLC